MTQNKLYSEEFYFDKAMRALEPIIENDFQARCLTPGCGYKSRKSLDRATVERLAAKHRHSRSHPRTALLNHTIRVDVQGRGVELPTVAEYEPPPF